VLAEVVSVLSVVSEYFLDSEILHCEQSSFASVDLLISDSCCDADSSALQMFRAFSKVNWISDKSFHRVCSLFTPHTILSLSREFSSVPKLYDFDRIRIVPEKE
jgi:hypothetical protein